MLSVVIATLDRAPLLRRVLDRLDAQDTGPEAFEVIVAADAAERDIAAVRAVAAGRTYDVRVVQAERPGVSAARNRGWPEARGAAVLFIGDDMLPERALVARHARHHAEHPEDDRGMIGHVRWADEIRPTPFMRWLDDGMQFDYGSILPIGPGWWHFVAANGSVKRAQLERVGGFDEDFRFGYEEMDLAARLHEVGFRLHYDPQARVEHLHPPTLEGWKRRMRAVAVAERQFHAKHPGLEPYFLAIFEAAAAEPPVRGRAARIARFVPRGLPRFGEHVWTLTGRWYAQQLAPPFLEAWRQTG